MIERAQGEDRSEAIVRLRLGSERVVAVGEGVGPVHALDQALRRALSDFYPALSGIHLVDYKVRILDGRAATSAVTRVMLTSADQIGEWTTVGVSDDIVTASWEALADGIAFGLLRAGADPPPTSPALFADAPQDIPLDLDTLPYKRHPASCPGRVLARSPPAPPGPRPARCCAPSGSARRTSAAPRWPWPRPGTR